MRWFALLGMLGAAGALAGCAARDALPASQGAASAFAHAVGGSSGPCYTSAAQPKWIFEGACKIGTLAKSGTSISLPRYRGVAMALKIAANNAGRNVKIVVADATGKHDVKPYDGTAFPPYPHPNQVLIYAQFVIGGTSAVRLKSGYLTLSFTAPSFPGTRCYLAALKRTTWLSNPKVRGKLSGHTLVFRAARKNQRIAPGAEFAAVYCT